MISLAALLLSVVAHQILGYAWYSPAPWAVARLRAINRPDTDVSRVDPTELLIDVVGWVLFTIVTDWLMAKTHTRGALSGAIFGAILWLGVAMPTLAPHYAFMSVQSIVLLVDSANVLVAAVISGAILGFFRSQPATAARGRGKK